ncbi:hypothetical protein ACFVYT_06540 [Streptomyces sp. NPDC058290]|uniref:hypothetical protein n=1 Tax=Streptomyces sp. NPDC058290 TaxID=3346426 RepID=UPI0036E8F81E
MAGTALGCAALSNGLIEEYRPPRLTPAALAGTWSDGRGGTLAFTAEGRVSAAGVEHALSHADDAVKPCTQPGTWKLVPGRTTWDQAVEVDIPGCTHLPWHVGGTSSGSRSTSTSGTPMPGTCTT